MGHSHHHHAHHHGGHHCHLIPAESGRLVRLASTASVAVAGFLILLKLAAWSLTDSLSLLSSLADSALDMLSSMVNFIAVRYALQPPDQEHRFGHGKAEDIAGMAQATFIAGSGLFILFEATRRFIVPTPLEHTGIGIAVMSISMAATLALVCFQRYVVRRTRSSAITADSLHYVTDLLSNAAVIVALLLSASLGWHWADPFFAVGIAAYILYNAWQVARYAFDNLMDREFAETERQRIEEIVKQHPRVRGIHNLKTRRSGIYAFIQFDLELSATMSLKETHAIVEEVMEEVKKAFPHAEIFVHQDPVE